MDLSHFLRTSLTLELVSQYTFTKGPDFTANQLPLLGHGIFSSDGTRWHAQRKLASRIFSSKLFREAYEPVLQADARKVVAHLRKAHELGAKIDLQMLLLRSTMDSFLTLAMGVHLNSLSTLEEATVEKGRYTLPRNEFGEAFDSLNSVVFKRNTNPLWNIEEPLMGFSGKVARWKKTIDEFALDVIRERKKKVEKGEEKKAKDLLDLFMEDGELGEEELRDVVVNFLIGSFVLGR